jgi:hypothetical protein
VITRDPDAIERFQHRWERRDEALVRTGQFDARRGPSKPLSVSPPSVPASSGARSVAGPARRGAGR